MVNIILKKILEVIDGELNLTPIRPWGLVQAKKVRRIVLSKMVVQESMGRPWVKCLDDPKHLENSMEINLQEPVKLNHMLSFQGMSKILVHRHNFQQRL